MVAISGNARAQERQWLVIEVVRDAKRDVFPDHTRSISTRTKDEDCARDLPE